jgi:hypothetical protein
MAIRYALGNLVRLAVCTLLLAGVLGRCAASGSLDPDWRLKAFDQANVALRENQEKEMEFLVSKEPTLKSYFGEIYVPLQISEERVRRVAFLRELQRAPETISWDSSPFLWALYPPTSKRIAELTKANDKEFCAAYSDYLEKLAAYRAATKWLDLRNKVWKQYPREMYTIETELVGHLNVLEQTVQARLVDRSEQRK